MGGAPGWSVGDQVRVLADVTGGPGEDELTLLLNGDVIAVDEDEEAIAVKVQHLDREGGRGYETTASAGLWFWMRDFFNMDGLNPGEVFIDSYFAQYEEE